MIKLIILILLTNFTVIEDLNKECEQYKLAYSYVKGDSVYKAFYGLGKNRIYVSDSLSIIAFHEVEQNDFLIGKLGLSNARELFDMDTSVVNPMRRELTNEWVELGNDKSPRTKLDCMGSLGVKFFPKVSMSFARYNDEVIVVYTSRAVNPRAEKGIYYLIFFDSENKIKRVLETTWQT